MSRRLLRDRSFQRLWAAHTTSSFGDALTSLALLLITQQLTGSTAAVAGTAIAIALPQLLVGLLAGVMVDRWSRRRVMIASDLVRAGLVLGFIAVTSSERLWLLYLIAFTQSAVGTFFNPARAAFLAEVLPSDRLLPANSLSEMSRVVAGVAGVAAAGVLASLGSLSVVFVVDSITFLVSAGLVALVPQSPRGRDGPRARVLADLVTGLALIARSRTLMGVVTAGAVGMLGLGAVNVLLVPFVVGVLGASEAWFGALEGAMVAAMVISGVLVAAVARSLQPTHLISAGAVGIGVGVGGIGFTHQVWQLLPLLFLAGASVTPLQASVTTLLQTTVQPEVRARTQAAFNTLVSGANLASISLAGAAAAAIGVRNVFGAAAVIVIAAGVAAHLVFRGAASASATPILERR
ncbi:MAG TPA: MFS transporter [Gaiellaceae bacterium]|nr:MFS transporter [Gaiellaceae bacterium]